MPLCFMKVPEIHLQWCAHTINYSLLFPFDSISSKCFKTARHHLIIILYLPLCKTLYVIM